MNAKSYWLCAPSVMRSSSVCKPGCSRRSILCATPACCQNGFAMRGGLSVVSPVGEGAGAGGAVVGQGERDRQRAVAGEDADLDRAARADQLHEQRHELALLGRDLHA